MTRSMRIAVAMLAIAVAAVAASATVITTADVKDGDRWKFRG